MIAQVTAFVLAWLLASQLQAYRMLVEKHCRQQTELRRLIEEGAQSVAVC
jgi:hypothetical protein